jgi:acetyl-CoA C-acetyltransferase
VSVAIYGAGTSTFGRQPDASAQELAWTAALEAFADAGVERVDAAYVGTVFGGSGIAQRCLSTLGITEIPIVTVENACASGTTAFHEGFNAVAAGRFETVLVLGVEHMTSRFKGAIHPADEDPEGKMGMALPGIYAMAASRYMAVHGLRVEQMAQVAVKNFGNALMNPRAMSRGDYTIEEILASRMIADPLTRLQCCSLSDGAAALILGKPRGGPRDVRIRASALRSGDLWDQRTDHVWGFSTVRKTAADAFAQAGLGVDDVDVFEVHDAFTIGEIITVEALGLAEEGAGGALVAAGDTALGGRHPVNPSGGLLARGHPVGATGTAQLYEVVTQLRGEAGERQVEKARIAAVETMGGGVSGLDGNACVIAVLEAPQRN